MTLRDKVVEKIRGCIAELDKLKDEAHRLMGFDPEEYPEREKLLEAVNRKRQEV